MDDRIVAAGAGAETRSGVVDETGGRTEKKMAGINGAMGCDGRTLRTTSIAKLLLLISFHAFRCTALTCHRRRPE
jgi:hypothetical protein